MDSTKDQVKLMSATTVREIARIGKKLDLNRKYAQSTLANLDEDAFHSCSLFMLHDKAQGVNVEPHYRCFTYTMVNGSDKPVEQLVDIPIDIFNRLRSIADLEAEDAGRTSGQHGVGKATH